MLDLSNPIEDDEDCPICKKYSQGPCGAFFKEWLQCTDDHPGKDVERKEENHIKKCHHLAVPLARCFEEHQAYYDEIDPNAIDHLDEEEEADEMELKLAWCKVIDTLEDDMKKSNNNNSMVVLSFPKDMQPDLQLRLPTNTGMVAFSLAHLDGEERPLICAYVKDQEGQILAAGSREDLWDWREGWGILQLAVLKVRGGGGALVLFQCLKRSLLCRSTLTLVCIYILHPQNRKPNP